MRGGYRGERHDRENTDIRHYLNENLLKEGGYIGDGIRPSELRKGYAAEMIRLALIEFEKVGFQI